MELLVERCLSRIVVSNLCTESIFDGKQYRVIFVSSSLKSSRVGKTYFVAGPFFGYSTALRHHIPMFANKRLVDHSINLLDSQKPCIRSTKKELDFFLVYLLRKTKKKLEGLEEGSRFSWLVVSKQSRACKITRTRISSLEASTGFFLHNVYLLLRMAR